MTSEDEREIPVVQSRDGSAPRATVLTGGGRPISLAEVKRNRYARNLKVQFEQFTEALAAAERFFVVCEVSEELRARIREAHEAALNETSARFQAKINGYDKRIEAAREAAKGGRPA